MMKHIPAFLFAAFLYFHFDISLLAQPETQWRLADQLSTPQWLDFNFQYRTRYETLDGQFRAGRTGGDQILAIRTSWVTQLNLSSVRVVAEVLDSRQALADAGTPLNTGIVNTMEPLQGFIEWNAGTRLTGIGETTMKFGRMTMDVGSRRLLARNRYRNTINSFTGLDWQTQFDGGWSFNAFYLLPQVRRPSTPSALFDHEVALDHEGFEKQFWGMAVEKIDLILDGIGQAQLFGLNEEDTAKYRSSDRRLITPALRFFRPSKLNAFDFDFETVFQFGTSRSNSNPANQTDLDHFAHFQHAEIGYTWDHTWSPRVAFQYDHASGDKNPTDGNNNRYDTLFGARRFDFGPTGIYGAFARSNIHSPGYRLTLKPIENIQLMFAHRFYWLASDTDAWTTSGVRDVTGNAGSYLGPQFEMRLRWDVIPKNLRLELGTAHLIAGDFIDNAPNSSGQGNTNYGYLQCVVHF